MSDINDYTDEELLEMKAFTKQEAREYIKEKTNAGIGLFKDCYAPRLNFRYMLKNLKRRKKSHRVVLKNEVDKLIIRDKKNLFSDSKDYTDEELLNMKVFRKHQAQKYVNEKANVGRGLFNDCIDPLLNFRYMLKNLKRKKMSHKVVPQQELDKVIIQQKKNLF